MRDHAIVSPKFWTGETGRFLRNHPDAQRLALYLLTCPSSNMIGLYYLPKPTLCHELNLTTKGASEALRRAFEGGFAEYDDPSEVVFVYRMASFQVGDSLRPGDNRIKAVERLLEQFRKTRFYNDFLERYGSVYHLRMKPLRSPFEAPSKPGTGTGSGSGSGIEDSPEPAEPASGPPALTFPVVGGDVVEWHLTQAKVQEYAQSFPGVDVMAEMRAARQWCIDNPSRRKTPSGMPKFCSGWLTKAQNNGQRNSVNRGFQPRGQAETQYAVDLIADALRDDP